MERADLRLDEKLLTMVLKLARVSRVVSGIPILPDNFEDKTYSRGFDPTVRIWDNENSVCIRTIVSISFHVFISEETHESISSFRPRQRNPF